VTAPTVRVGGRGMQGSRGGLALVAMALSVMAVVAVGAVLLSVGRGRERTHGKQGVLAGPAGGRVPAGFGVGSVSAINARTWWVLGYGRRMCGLRPCVAIVRTTDGGRSFVSIQAPRVDYQPEPAGHTPGVAEIHFANPRDGYVYFNSLFVTHDGGATWDQPRLPVVRVWDVRSAAGEAYMLAQRTDGSFMVLRSPVGGDRWVAVPGTRSVTGISAHGRNLYATAVQGSRFYILASHDAGATVIRHYIAPWGDIRCGIQAVSDADLWALCAGGMASSLFWSGNGGRTLRSIGTHLSLTNGAVLAARSPHSLVVGFQKLYRTDDGGDTFTPIPTPRAPEYGPNHTLQWTYLAFADPEHGLALAQPASPTSGQPIHTYLFKTADGGLSYNLVRITDGAARPPAAGSAVAHSCSTRQLKITTIHSFAGLGHSGAYIAFTNESRRTCALRGWPKLVAITAAGRTSEAVDYPASSFEVTGTGIGVPVVRLNPGQRADAEFKAVDGAVNRCPPSYRWLHVTPPDNNKSVRITAWVRYLGAYLPSCGGVAVSPVLPRLDLMGG
jgi:uncharacterized protein DUF4232